MGLLQQARDIFTDMTADDIDSELSTLDSKLSELDSEYSGFKE